MKKIISLWVAFLCIFTLCASVAVADVAPAEAPETVSATPTTVYPVYADGFLGSDPQDKTAFRVGINISLGSDAVGFDTCIVTVSWNPDALTPVYEKNEEEFCSFEDTYGEGWQMVPNGFTSMLNTNNVKNGSVTVNSAHYEDRKDENGDPVREGTLFTLNFAPTGKSHDYNITVRLGSSNVAPDVAISSSKGVLSNVVALTSTYQSLVQDPWDANNDGEVDALDYFKIKRFVLGIESPNRLELIHADVNQDGILDALDYFRMKKKILSIEA